MTVALIQTHLNWENSEANMLHFDQKINQIENAIDLIVLPEMFSTGFTMQPQLFAESIYSPTFKWLLNKVQQKNCAIVGSLSFKDQNKFYNRLFWVYPNGTYTYYNKQHLFSMGNEHKHYTAERNSLIVNYKGCRFKPLICYDLRFPTSSIRTKQLDYDVLI